MLHRGRPGSSPGVGTKKNNQTRKEAIMHTRTLLLTPWYFPLKILRWQDAVKLRYEELVDVVVEYEDEIRSPSVTWRVPAVVRLRKMARIGESRREVQPAQRVPAGRLPLPVLRRKEARARAQLRPRRAAFRGRAYRLVEHRQRLAARAIHGRTTRRATKRACGRFVRRADRRRSRSRRRSSIGKSRPNGQASRRSSSNSRAGCEGAGHPRFGR